MASIEKATDGPSPEDSSAWDYHTLPDWDNDFYDEDSVLAFASALAAPDNSQSELDLLNPRRQVQFITALNDWRPIHQNVKSVKRRKRPRRGKDETREGLTYSLVKYPLLLFVLAWIVVLSFAYLLTRYYIYFYERHILWRGTRDKLRKELRKSKNYEDWVQAAKALDSHLGIDKWKEEDEYAYYDSRTIKRAMEQMKRLRYAAESEEKKSTQDEKGGLRAIDKLVTLAESCVKNNFAGTENPRLYSQTYYGTKDLSQDYIDEVSTTLKFLFASKQLTNEEKRSLAKHMSTNFGRTALCLSGGATFSFYHFGLAKALLDANLLPNLITGTSGGAIVAALLATRTDEELKRLLIPALATRIVGCNEPISVWFPRWWRTGARFDSVDWAKRCAWFCRGNLTFLEAYHRTGRILNVSCIPSDPHSPTILANYLTAPDCVIWSAVLASAAVPGLLNPVVLMRKNRDGKLEPFSFGHKWKDGSLKTDIPLKSLNLHFNVNFSIVGQVNPHISLFFFSSRGTIGRPVTHRSGRGWRGGFIGSAIEQYLKLDLNKWLKVLRHLELLPRPADQDWSEIWLQRFSGTITIWPKSVISDYWHILADPSMQRLARMIRVGQLATWPKLKFVSNRMAIEKVIEEARENLRPVSQRHHNGRPLRNVLSEEDLQSLLEESHSANGLTVDVPPVSPLLESNLVMTAITPSERQDSPSLSKRFSGWFSSRAASPTPTRSSFETTRSTTEEMLRARQPRHRRHGSFIEELRRQSSVFFDDIEVESTHDETESDHEHDRDRDTGHDRDDFVVVGLRRAKDRGWKLASSATTTDASPIDSDNDGDGGNGLITR